MISYAVFVASIVAIALFADSAVGSAVLRAPQLVAQVVFTPLLAGWSIWVGIGISARTNDTRVAQQLSVLASLPTVIVTSLIAFGVIHATFKLALVLGIALLVLDRLGWRFVSALFDRERLITGTRT
jgi:ABC-2 type transport system permease protein